MERNWRVEGVQEDRNGRVYVGRVMGKFWADVSVLSRLCLPLSQRSLEAVFASISELTASFVRLCLRGLDRMSMQLQSLR